MPLPLPSQAHVDSLLTNVSVAYKQNASNFIHNVVAPEIAVAKQSDLYRVFTKTDWLRDEVGRRAPGTESVRIGYNLSTVQYYCDVFAASEMIDDQLRANFDQPGDPDMAATEHLMQKMMIRKERQWASDCFATSIWGTDVTLAGADQWSDPIGSDPKEDIHVGQATVLQNTGFMPNTMVVGFQVHQALQRHPLVREQFKYTSAESINEQMLARFFEVDRYLVSKAVYGTNFENATAAQAFALGKSCLLCYVAPSPGLMTPSAMYQFSWAGLVGGVGGQRVKNIPMPWLGGNLIEIEASFDFKVVASDLGYFLASAVA